MTASERPKITPGGGAPSGAFYEAALQRLAPATGPTWLAELQREAAGWFREHGFPHPKDEGWRFTPTRAVVSTAFEPAAASAELPAGAHLALLGGRPVIGDSLPDGVQALSLSQTADSWPAELPRVGTLAGPVHGFAALNTASFGDALVLRIRGNVIEPIVLHVAGSGSADTVSYPRLLVCLEPGASATLVETHAAVGDAAQLSNAVSEVFVGANAQLEHVRVVHGSAGTRDVQLLSVQQERDSRYRSRVATMGGALVRLDVRVRLSGPAAECELDGVYFAGDSELVDHHLRVDHAADHTHSQQTYRGVLSGNGRAVFDGIAAVGKGTRGAGAHQENRNLLLSNDAVVHTKPHLEIDADELTASHGATVGQLDDNEVFYMRARGISEDAARAALTFAFLEQVVERIPVDSVRRNAGEALLARLPNGGALKELL